MSIRFVDYPPEQIKHGWYDVGTQVKFVPGQFDKKPFLISAIEESTTVPVRFALAGA